LRPSPGFKKKFCGFAERPALSAHSFDSARFTGRMHKLVADRESRRRGVNKELIASFTSPYYSAQWYYPIPAYWPPMPDSPIQDWRHWMPFAYGFPHSPWIDRDPQVELKDYGGKPFVINIERAAERNRNYRTALWTGKHLQVTLMSIPVGGDIGLEVHPHVDQFIRIEQGQGLVQMGERRDRLHFSRRVSDGDAIMIPAGTWHNVTNTGRVPLKLYSIYAPPEHPFGTVHRTKAEAMAAHR
jgi:mannose-6-phosphate isomerase-like protein (cupin superfamily)